LFWETALEHRERREEVEFVLTEEVEVAVEVTLDVEDVSMDEELEAVVWMLDAEEVTDEKGEVVVETLVDEEVAVPRVSTSK
jgi:hypothetical protein